MSPDNEFEGCNWCGEYEDEYTEVEDQKVCIYCKERQGWHLEAAAELEEELSTEFGEATLERHKNSEAESLSPDDLIDYGKQLEDILSMLENFHECRQEAEDYVADQEIRIKRMIQNCETTNQLKWAFRMMEVYTANFGLSAILMAVYGKKKTQLTAKKVGSQKQNLKALAEPQGNAMQII